MVWFNGIVSVQPICEIARPFILIVIFLCPVKYYTMHKRCYMVSIKKNFLRFLPYGTSILFGLIIYFIGIYLNDNLKSLFVNVSAAFLSIPLLFLFYEVFRKFSHRRLNKEIYNYAKLQIDSEVLSILSRLTKLVYPVELQDLSINSLNRFIWIPMEELHKLLLESQYLGFQIYNKWDKCEKYFEDVLKNTFVLDKLEDESIICIIEILKAIKSFEQAFSIEDLYIQVANNESDYKITGDLSTINATSRLLLLKKVGNEQYQVKDFGDFHISDRDKLLCTFRVNEHIVNYFIQDILNVLASIIKWLDSTGKEIILDTNQFKLITKCNTKS